MEESQNSQKKAKKDDKANTYIAKRGIGEHWIKRKLPLTNKCQGEKIVNCFPKGRLIEA